jgi:hypothetical protein
MSSHVCRDALRPDIRRMSKRATTLQKTSIEDRRRKLESRLDNFHHSARQFIGGNGDDDLEMLPQVTGWEKGDDELSDDDSESSCDEDGVLGWEDDDEETEPVENASIAMPSSYGIDIIKDLGLGDLATQELELRKGQANDWLKELHLALGHKAALYRTGVRDAKSTSMKTRAWDDVKAMTVKVTRCVRGYRRTRIAMERLGADHATLKRYSELLREDLKLSADITEENRFGQRNDVLPWFWRLDGANDEEGNTWMKECEYYIYTMTHRDTNWLAVHRVNWLRAKARYDQWKEEWETVKNEMIWTQLWFRKQRSVWMGRGERSQNEGKPGHEAYAKKQVALWKKFEARAAEAFKGLEAGSVSH